MGENVLLILTPILKSILEIKTGTLSTILKIRILYIPLMQSLYRYINNSNFVIISFLSREFMRNASFQNH